MPLNEVEDLARQAFQVLVFPYRLSNNGYEYCLFLRDDMSIWQGIAGGGEGDEQPIDTAIRETAEEAGIKHAQIWQLKATTCIPSVMIKQEFLDRGVLLINEYAFGAKVDTDDIVLSDEHKQFIWCSYDEAYSKLHWDSNRTALWELNYRLTNDALDNYGNEETSRT